MIMMENSFDYKYRKQIIEFCNNNDLIISYINNIGKMDYYNIHGNFTNLHLLEKYILKLNNNNNEYNNYKGHYI